MLNTAPQTLPSISPLRQLFYLALIAFGCLVAGALLCWALVNAIYGFDIINEMAKKSGVHPKGYLTAMRLFVGFGNTLMGFLLPAIIFAFLTVRKPDAYLRYRNKFPALLLVFVVLFFIFFTPVIDITAYYNQQLSLPGPLKWLEEKIRTSDKSNEAMIKNVLVMNNIGDLLMGILLVGLLPAIAEEFLFRGCLQSILQRWGMSLHAAVWLAAFIFSFIHFAFLGFVPRMLLGAALGYFFAYSGSIWPAVLAHFLNNTVAVVGYYLTEKKIISAELDSNTPMVGQLWICGLCLLTAIFIMMLYQRYAIKKRLSYGEALD